MGNSALISQVDARAFITEQFGLPTINDILKELAKPGRDPRPEFKTATFAEGVETMNDLVSGMILEGTVTNVTNFGAFVDIGVHQDGLVHISSLADRFIEDPHTVVKTGDIVKVKVLEVDLARKRIALTMRLDEVAGDSDKKQSSSNNTNSSRNNKGQKPARNSRQPINNGNNAGNSAMGDALAAAFGKKTLRAYLLLPYSSVKRVKIMSVM